MAGIAFNIPCNYATDSVRRCPLIWDGDGAQDCLSVPFDLTAEASREDQLPNIAGA